MTCPIQLSALDAGFLAAESDRTPLHVGSVSLFEGAPWRTCSGRLRMAQFRAMVESRLPLVPQFRQRLMSPPGALVRPWWVDDPHFDIRHHVRHTRLDSPGSLGQLYELAAGLHMELLDRDRPLWELWVVDGLADGRVALVEKVHHALIDGVAGIDVAMVLMDLSRHPVPNQMAGPPSRGTLVGTLLRRATATGQSWSNAVMHPRGSLAQATSVVRAGAALVSSGLTAPVTSLNQPIGYHRRLEGLVVSLTDLKYTGRALGVTVNDLVLTGVAGGLRRLLLERGERPTEELKVLVPVSTRSQRGAGRLGNQVAAILAPLPLGESDPAVRLHRVHEAMVERKGNGQADLTGLLGGLADWLPVPAVTVTARLVHRQPFVNLVVTNVPGADVDLYMMGARLEESIPVVPLAANLDLSIGVMSYRDQLAFGLYADSELCPDLPVLAEGITTSIDEIHHLVRRTTRRTA